jgi:hypothetical protein
MADITGALTFREAKFTHMEAQEEACRKAKQTWETLGDRKIADDHFYREMEAKRKQKPWRWRGLDVLVAQTYFGYGVK